VQIEKNVPLPPRTYNKAGRNTRYPFPEMGIGDSFLLKLPADPKKAKTKRSVISCLMIYHSRKRGTKYASRSIAEGLRVWRVA
jgi:hypothetical protein